MAKKIFTLHRVVLWFRTSFYEIIFFFPVHLFIYHIKKNQIILTFWLVLFAVVCRKLGDGMGIPYLFLAPEYLDRVNALSFCLVGVSLGSFIISFHITTYILNGYRYNFLINVPYPFIKFCINNSLWPLLFNMIYIWCFVHFQVEYEDANTPDIILKILGFLAGEIFVFLSSSAYFIQTNMAIFRSLSEKLDRRIKKTNLQRVNVMERLKAAKQQNVIIHSYIEPPLRIKLVSNKSPYHKDMIIKVFDQTQLNAFFIQIFALGSIILLGLFRHVPGVQIPAAASMLLLFSVLLLLSGAIAYWFKEWAVTLTLIGIVLISLFYKNSSVQDPFHRASGISYDSLVAYEPKHLDTIHTPEHAREDYLHTIGILENWKNKFDMRTKPKMIFISVSGGGLHAAVWTLNILQYLDSLTNGVIQKNTVLISGSSGGLIGAAYFRELALRKRQGQITDMYDKSYVESLAKDKLNSLIFSGITYDLFFSLNKLYVSTENYYIDRGHALEYQLNTDTKGYLDKKLGDYRLQEQHAEIPLMIISPTILNDGRKLVIASQPMSYMSRGTVQNRYKHINSTLKAIEFRRMFAHAKPDSLHFLSALRMSATFPYVTPNVVLPSYPFMEVADAGIVDNFGIANLVVFMNVFKGWIAENTSEVILIEIRNTPKVKHRIPPRTHRTVFQNIITPITDFLLNLTNKQDYYNDYLLEQWSKDPALNMHVFSLQYRHEQIGRTRGLSKKVSLSWRLTSKEKESIITEKYSPANKAVSQALVKAFQPVEPCLNK